MSAPQASPFCEVLPEADVRSWIHSETADGPILRTFDHVPVSLWEEADVDVDGDPFGEFTVLGFLAFAEDRARLVEGQGGPGENNARSLIEAMGAVRSLLRADSPLMHGQYPHRWARRLIAKLLDVGRHFERMMIRAAEPDAARGQKVHAGARKGHERRYGNQRAKDEKWTELQRTCLRLRERRPELSTAEIQRLAAEEAGVSVSTIKRRVSISPRQSVKSKK